MVETTDSSPATSSDTLSASDTLGISNMLASARIDTDALGSEGEDPPSDDSAVVGSAGKSSVSSSFLASLGSVAYGGGRHFSAQESTYF